MLAINCLKSLNDELSLLRSAGVDVVAITAEPGGQKAIQSRLAEKGIVLDFEVRSDPNHLSLKGLAVGDYFVIHPAAPEDAPVPYQMIEPALIVTEDASPGEGATTTIIPECSWSWKTMGYEDVEEMGRVPTQPWAGGPAKEVALVTLRPVMSDLLLAIKEKRQVKLASTHEDW